MAAFPFDESPGNVTVDAGNIVEARGGAGGRRGTGHAREGVADSPPVGAGHH